MIFFFTFPSHDSFSFNLEIGHEKKLMIVSLTCVYIIEILKDRMLEYERT